MCAALKRLLFDHVQLRAWEVSCECVCVLFVCLDVFVDEDYICVASEGQNMGIL